VKIQAFFACIVTKAGTTLADKAQAICFLKF